jgi:hypothetical protein
MLTHRGVVIAVGSLMAMVALLENTGLNVMPVTRLSHD